MFSTVAAFLRASFTYRPYPDSAAPGRAAADVQPVPPLDPTVYQRHEFDQRLRRARRELPRQRALSSLFARAPACPQLLERLVGRLALFPRRRVQRRQRLGPIPRGGTLTMRINARRRSDCESVQICQRILDLAPGVKTRRAHQP